jgi:hypothetical protein
MLSLKLSCLFSYVYVNIVKIVRNLKARRAKIKHYYYSVTIHFNCDSENCRRNLECGVRSALISEKSRER